ncbi:hypothetical protein KC336_g23288, partial [Hortaea werneckii]
MASFSSMLLQGLLSVVFKNLDLGLWRDDSRSIGEECLIVECFFTMRPQLICEFRCLEGHIHSLNS